MKFIYHKGRHISVDRINSWFKDREPLLYGIGNAAELEIRLLWLSEGSLKYNLDKESGTSLSCPEEKELYREFMGK